MSVPGESESKLDTIIRKFLEKYLSLNKTENDDNPGVAEIYGILQENGQLPPLVEKDPKSGVESENFRVAGNTAYKMKEFDEALLNYTRAICCAQPGSEPIALAYANRSAVHFELQAHYDVIKDVNHALDSGKYPEHMKHKLFERRAKSYLALSQYQRALDDLKTVIAYVTGKSIVGRINQDQENVKSDVLNGNFFQDNDVSHTINCDSDLHKLITHPSDSEQNQRKVISYLLEGNMEKEKVHRLKSLIELMAKCIGNPDLPQQKPTEPKLSHKPSKNAKGPFPALEIAVSPEMGKHVVAATSISPGDVLAVEKPHVSVLTPEFLAGFCDNCKTRCHSSVPCNNCTRVVYCTENCRQRGWESHHSIECDLLPTVIDLGCKVNVLIGIRGLLKATRCGKDLQGFVEESKNVGAKSKGNKTSKNRAPKINQSDAFYSVHNLVTHAEDRSKVQMLGAIATVSCVIHILKGATRFFGSTVTKESHLSVDCIAAANLILRYFMMAGCNAFEIGESVFLQGQDFTDCEFRVIGGALYPTFCLLNHSCDPDVTAYMADEETRVLYAVKPVRKGDQVFISYGPEYIHHDLPTRQKQLKSKYFFTCGCPACTNNWPLANNLPEYPKFISLWVESAQGPRIFETCNKLPEILQAADKGPITQEQLQTVIQYLSLYHKYVIRPWKYLFAAERVIRQYFSYKGKHNNGKTPKALV